MSNLNVIPSVPSLYPQLSDHSQGSDMSLRSNDFRLKKICDCEKEIERKISHYLKVLKKYKRAKYVAHNCSYFAGLISVTLTSGGLAISLSGIGVIVGAPLTGVAALSGIIAAAFTIVSKKLSKKDFKT